MDSEGTWKVDAPQGREQRAETLRGGRGSEGREGENKAWQVVGRVMGRMSEKEGSTQRKGLRTTRKS